MVWKKGGSMNCRKFLIPVLVVSMAAAGRTQTTETLNFKVAGTSRNCVIHVPSGMSKPAVVFFIHGAVGSGAAFEKATKGDVVADKEKFIAAYPSASSNGETGTWDDMYGTGNFPFFLAVIDTLDARYRIDRNRVYMTGFSQGGMISFAAGCSYSNVFAAVAPVSGHSGTTCTLKRPVSVFMTFGTNDMGTPSTFIADLNIWLKLDSCPSTPTITRPYPSTNPQSGVTRISYGPCAQGTFVVADSIQGEGHQWPATNRLNQAEEVWAFFKQFSLAASTAARQQSFPMARESISAFYSSGIIRLPGAGEKCNVRVFDTKGGLVTTAAAVHRQFAFNDKPSGVYVVIVNGNDRSFSLRMVIP
jgi:poly(3-hydroxybutyrate) depolymerase